MELRFSYNLEKDVENYQKASQSANNKKPTRMQALYISEFGDVFEGQTLKEFITRYVKEQDIDLEAQAARIEAAWQPLNEEYFKRVKLIFGSAGADKVVDVFLTTDTRCSYNIEQGYFFVSVSRPFQNKTIMHELLHFWTWYAFHEEVESGRMTKECYNDVKESLTELLNVEFADLLDGVHDDGYPQHQEMRALVRKTWVETKDIKRTFDAAGKSCVN